MSALIRVDPRWPGAWDTLQDFLTAALERGGGLKDWSLQDLREAAQTERVALWGVVDDDRVLGATVTVVTQYPQRRVLEVLAMGCERDTEEQWLPCWIISSKSRRRLAVPLFWGQAARGGHAN